MTELRLVVDQQLHEAFGEVGQMDPPLLPELPVGQVYRWGHTVLVSRDLMLMMGLAEPTPQEAADRAASHAWAREWHAARIQRWAEWFSAVREVAGEIGAAMLDLHVPNEHDDCEACTGEETWVAWPCATVLAAAAAAGIPEPEAI